MLCDTTGMLHLKPEFYKRICNLFIFHCNVFVLVCLCMSICWGELEQGQTSGNSWPACHPCGGIMEKVLFVFVSWLTLIQGTV